MLFTFCDVFLFLFYKFIYPLSLSPSSPLLLLSFSPPPPSLAGARVLAELAPSVMGLVSANVSVSKFRNKITIIKNALDWLEHEVCSRLIGQP